MLIVPSALLIVGVLCRRLGRRDGDEPPGRNDWAVATAIFLMLLATVVRDIQAGKIPPDYEMPLVIGTFVCALASTDYDRRVSWIRDANGKPTDRKRMLVGILLPDGLSLALFAFYQLYWGA